MESWPGPTPGSAGTRPLDALRRAGRIAAAARSMGAALVAPGVRVRDVCEAVDGEIESLGGEPAFPTQSSRNEVAAHYCPSPEDETVYREGDLAKLDIGVHVEGWVVDTATTVDLGGGRGSNGRLVEAAEAALRAALAVARPGIPIAHLSRAIFRELRCRDLRPMSNLCGHGLARWTVHCPPAIPNSPDGSTARLEAGMVVAIEPFATDGAGDVAEWGAPEVFRLPAGNLPGADPEAEEDVLAAIARFRGLPFCRRQLRELARERVETTLRALWRRGALAAYPPLAERSGRPVAQAEHSLFVGTDGVEVLTL